MRYQSSRPKRRFLAGVRCPKCQALDAVVQVNIVTPAPDEYIECTQCDHIERRPDPDAISAKNHLEDQMARDAMTTGTSGTVKFKP
ncbi:YheV family putative metal-binding protein [Psychrobacter sp.]|uniref:YheV family putative metal-binding protein n=1 Tax=Psychrobacter sp. TaxID=56811 RepID=UPI002648F969|nr:YheV family putative metal-binding protein [Psychrobacter sp.]MDN6275391.1 YheV family putative metal-binding protein [Psychrobacter sp.]MDN6307731.1 YheV family putative metal-binding protein [Psychrobacter sp.]